MHLSVFIGSLHLCLGGQKEAGRPQSPSQTACEPVGGPGQCPMSMQGATAQETDTHFEVRRGHGLQSLICPLQAVTVETSDLTSLSSFLVSEAVIP